jgi:hypothetical protein
MELADMQDLGSCVAKIKKFTLKPTKSQKKIGYILYPSDIPKGNVTKKERLLTANNNL